MKLERLNSNKLVDLNELVSSLENLRWLNVSPKNIQWIYFAHIQYTSKISIPSDLQIDQISFQAL